MSLAVRPARPAAWLLACASLGLLGAGCVEATSGGGPPCGDEVSFQLSTPGETWTEGRYELAMTLDVGNVFCTLELDQPLPAMGQREFTCDSTPGAFGRAYLSNLEECGGATPCEPGGPYALLGAIYASPDQIWMVLRRDGQTLLDERASPSYTEEEISGGQACRSTPPLTFGPGGG